MYRYHLFRCGSFEVHLNTVILNPVYLSKLNDNVPDKLLVDEMRGVEHCKDEVKLQQCANTIALMARNLSKDPKVSIH